MGKKSTSNKSTSQPLGKTQLAIQAAVKYFEENKIQKEIAEDLNLRHSSSVSRLLKYAEKIGIVRHEIRPEFGEPPKRSSSLETALMKAFNLQNAIVAGGTGYERGFSATKDEILHRILGMGLAERFRTMLRPNDHIGVTGGRATYYTARKLGISYSSSLKQRGIMITSLGGNVNATISSLKASIDADDVAYQLYLAFESAILRRLSLPVAVTSPGVKRELIAKGQGIAISSELWKTGKVPVPTLAIMGIGVLDVATGHRFLNLDGYELEPIKSQLSALINLIKPLKYCPVGDIGYRLFYIEPPDRTMALDRNTVRKIKKLINSLNDRILCINEEQLRLINTVLVIGGGPLKVNAIWQVLTSVQAAPLVDELCTDEITARKLLKRAEVSTGTRG